MATPEERLAELGLSVPDVVPPVAAYVPAVRSGAHVFTAGQIPMRDGTLVATGKVGDTATPEQATEAAQQCALNALAAIRSVTGTLERVGRDWLLVRGDRSTYWVPREAVLAVEFVEQQ